MARGPKNEVTEDSNAVMSIIGRMPTSPYITPPRKLGSNYVASLNANAIFTKVSGVVFPSTVSALKPASAMVITVLGLCCQLDIFQ